MILPLLPPRCDLSAPRPFDDSLGRSGLGRSPTLSLYRGQLGTLRRTSLSSGLLLAPGLDGRFSYLKALRSKGEQSSKCSYQRESVWLALGSAFRLVHGAPPIRPDYGRLSGTSRLLFLVRPVFPMGDALHLPQILLRLFLGIVRCCSSMDLLLPLTPIDTSLHI